jgi:hypothetical protein
LKEKTWLLIEDNIVGALKKMKSERAERSDSISPDVLWQNPRLLQASSSVNDRKFGIGKESKRNGEQVTM